MRVVVVGSATFARPEMLAEILEGLGDVELVTAADGEGVDRLVMAWARARGRTVYTYRANWARFGRGAGVMRSRVMLKDAAKLVALWDGRSTRTKSVIELAGELGIPFEVIRFLPAAETDDHPGPWALK